MAGDENGGVRRFLIAVLLTVMAADASALAARKVEAPRQATAAGTHAVPAPEARVDINQASVAELMKVPGMTRSWAGRIVRFRPYHAKTDLLDRGVLPSYVYDRIKDSVVAHRVKKQD